MCYGSHYRIEIFKHNNWVYQIYLIINFLNLFIFDLLYVMQIYEWIVLIFILVTQKSKFNLEEIIPMIKSKEYKKKEKCLSCTFISVSSLQSTMYLILLALMYYCSNLLVMPMPYYMFILGVSILFCIFKAITFAYLMYLLKTISNYEFRLNKNSLQLYFILDTVAYSIEVCV